MAPDPALTALREQLDRTQDAARKLAAEAAGAAARRPPATGWQRPETGAARPADELAALVALVDAVRDLVPAELWDRLVGVVHELLLAVRALVDLAIQRTEARRASRSSSEVEDIPIR